MKTLPLYGLPYLEGTDLGKDIPATSLKMAQQTEAALSRGGAIPIGADLQQLVTKTAGLENTGQVGVPAAAGVTVSVPITVQRINGVVYLQGRATGAGTLCTLPVGFRPTALRRLSVLEGISGTGTCVLLVDVDGLVRTNSGTMIPNMYDAFPASGL